MAKKNRNFTPGWIAANLTAATGTHVSARTISRRLNQVGLFAREPLRCIPLQPRHRRERLRLGVVGSDFLFWTITCGYTEALKYRTHSKVKIFSVYKWPAYSPDLNPTEHAWDTFGKRVAQRTIPPGQLNDSKPP
ncbi:hypothetical protein TNCV_325201 [Trichonephila clavipes]|nr:hypothetical protein TNCV_325201 [Trichonephila clavipes]